jgi:hypothetical protein
MPLRWNTRVLITLFLVVTASASALFGLSQVQAQTTNSVTLIWTAPGDDGTLGRASRYDLRYSANAISGTDTTSWWNSATIVNMTGKTPAAAGQLDSMVVSGLLSGTRYYAILRTADEVLNWSGYSNVAVFDVLDKLAPARVADLKMR